MIPRLLTFILPPVIGLGASYAFVPLASGALPPDPVAPAMVQAAEAPSEDVWSRLGEIEEVSEQAVFHAGGAAEPLGLEQRIGRLSVFQKPDPEAGEVLSRVMKLGRFKTRVERDGTLHNLSVDLALEFDTHEAALEAYDPAALMRLRDVALNAVIAAGQDERVYRSGFEEADVRRSLEAVILADLPEVAKVHLVRAELREGRVRTAMSR